MKIKQILAASGFILALGIAQPASAVLSFAFDPTGTGSFGTYTGLTTLDQAPGNALAVGGQTAINNFITNTINGNNALPTTFTLDYQANLNSILGTNSYANSTGAGGNYFNFTMQLQEQVATVSGTSATFTASSGTIQMYVNNAPANNLSGVGFGGTQILSASFDPTQFQSSNFTTVQNATGDINQFTAGNAGWGTTQTVQGTGGSIFNFKNVVVNANYFQGLSATSVLQILSSITTSQNLPFNTVDPSLAFLWDGGRTSNVGSVNGSLTVGGPDVLFLADLSQTFTSRTVPEPETLYLLGLGLAGLSFARKRAQT